MTLTAPPTGGSPQRSVRLRLPYTSPPLSLNQRGHWATKARRIKNTRRDVGWTLRAQNLTPFHRVRAQLGYVPRDNRHRDTDNLVATLKAVCDAIVDAGLVPDDTPQWMAKPEPIICPADPADPHLWLLLTEISEEEPA